MYVHRWGSDVVVRAPAKLNLFFEVLGKRSDGFHEVETLMVPIGVYDTLLLRANAAGPIEVDCRWASAPSSGVDPALGDLPQPADNIVTRALLLLREAAGLTAGAQVWLTKRIPSAAGLGGGSSDAAAALLAASQAWNLNWPLARLSELAARLGSDVPFFLGDVQGRTRAAMCRGRGEQIDPVASLGSLHFVVVRPPAGLSTAAVYAACRPGSPARSAEPLVAALRTGCWRGIRSGLHNRLEEAADGLSEWIGRLRSHFAQLDCVVAQMSGSGSSYFGICRSARHARRVAARLQGFGVGRVLATASCS